MAFGTRTIWAALTATGSTAGVNTPGNDFHTVQVVITGGPSAASYTLQGSLDGTNWFDISDAVTTTSSNLFHVVNRAVDWVRINLGTLSGGTSPSLLFSYLGHCSGGRV